MNHPDNSLGIDQSARLLLLSNSRDNQGRYLHHAKAAIAAHLAGVDRALFVPYAAVTVSFDEYRERVQQAVSAAVTQAAVGADTTRSVVVDSLHEQRDPAEAVHDAQAIIIGGGNTFHLLQLLHHYDVVQAIRERVMAGTPYIGWSAGSVVACPTLGTTNDMPIVQPKSFDALALVPFQINAHFTDVHPPGFQGETRRERLAEYVMANPSTNVIGLPEGDWLDVQGSRVTLHGDHPAFLFRAGESTRVLEPGQYISPLLH